MKKLIIFLLLAINCFATISIKDETGVISKDFIKEWEGKYTDKNKEIHVIIKESMGNIKPVVYGAQYFRENDLGGKGSGILILIYTKTPWMQVVVGTKVEEIFTDSYLVENILKPMQPYFYSNLQKCISVGLDSSIKILNGVVK